MIKVKFNFSVAGSEQTGVLGADMVTYDKKDSHIYIYSGQKKWSSGISVPSAIADNLINSAYNDGTVDFVKAGISFNG